MELQIKQFKIKLKTLVNFFVSLFFSLFVFVLVDWDLAARFVRVGSCCCDYMAVIYL